MKETKKVSYTRGSYKTTGLYISKYTSRKETNDAFYLESLIRNFKDIVQSRFRPSTNRSKVIAQAV